jgi:hypothetical protein
MHPDVCVITCQTSDVITHDTITITLYAVHKGVSTPLFRQLQIGIFVESVHEAEFVKANPYFQ